MAEESTGSLIEGQAVEFAQVVTQTRSIADTELKVVGEPATTWMSIAQCFARPAGDPAGERPASPGVSAAGRAGQGA